MSKYSPNKRNQIIRDAKQCFQSLDLPINNNEFDKDSEIVFTSQICNDHVCAIALVSLHDQVDFISIDINFSPKVPSAKMVNVWQLLNLLNGMMPIYHYSICPRCNGISLRSALFLSEEILPKGKFKRLVQDMLDDAYLCFPLIEEVAKAGNPEILYDRFMDDHKDIMKMEGRLSKEVISKILGDMKSVFAELKMSRTEVEIRGNMFIKDFVFQDMDIPLRMGIELAHENEIITMNLAPPFTVPHEKIPMVTELVTHLNRGHGPNHFFIHRESHRVVLLKGIMIGNGILDKKEFKMAVCALLEVGCKVFPIIKEQLSTNEKPDALVNRIFGITKCNE